MDELSSGSAEAGAEPDILGRFVIEIAARKNELQWRSAMYQS
jgi:hypothetical protein